MIDIAHDFALLIAGALLGYRWGCQDTRDQKRQGEYKIMSTALDTQQFRVFLVGTDYDGLTTDTLTNVTATVDRPDLIEVTPDPTSPGQFIVRAVKQAAPVAGPIAGNVTITDASGVSATAPYSFSASAPVTAVLVSAIEPIPGTNPSDASAPVGGSSASPDGSSTVAPEPVGQPDEGINANASV